MLDKIPTVSRSLVHTAAWRTKQSQF